MSRILAQISTPVVIGLRYFELGRFIGKSDKNLSRYDDRSTTIPNLGWVCPPTPRTVGVMGTPKGKSGKFRIYPHFQRPAPSTSPPIGALAHAKRLLCHISQFASYISQGAGQKSAPPTGVNLGPRHISETIRDRKLKFYPHIDKAKCTFCIRKLASQGAAPLV